MLVEFCADFCQTQAGSWPTEANTTEMSRNLDQSFKHSFISALYYLHNMSMTATEFICYGA